MATTIWTPQGPQYVPDPTFEVTYEISRYQYKTERVTAQTIDEAIAKVQAEHANKLVVSAQTFEYYE